MNYVNKFDNYQAKKTAMQTDAMITATKISNLRTFEELMELATIKKLFKFVSFESFEKYNKSNLIPHYTVGGKRAFSSHDVCEWITENLVDYDKGKKLITKFISYPQKNTNPKKIPPQLIGIKGKLQEIGSPPPCVYFLINIDEVVYVGQTVNIYSRIKHHENSEKIYTRVLYIPVCNEELERVERGFIDSLDPKYNKDGKTMKKRKEAYEN